LQGALAAAAQPDAVASRLRPLIELGADAAAGDEARLLALLETAEVEGLAALRLPVAAIGALARRRHGSSPRFCTALNLEHGDDVATVLAETRLAAEAGAEEIDLGIPLAAVLEGDLALVGELIQAASEVAGGARLGAILEARELTSPADLTAAARSAIMGGAGSLTTDSGGRPSDLAAIATLLAVLEEAEGRVGLKVPAGPDLEPTGAAVLHLADHILGKDWGSPATLRLMVEA
jgi:deoxyribose-phosphate aldolase